MPVRGTALSKVFIRESLINPDVKRNKQEQEAYSTLLIVLYKKWIDKGTNVCNNGKGWKNFHHHIIFGCEGNTTWN